MVIFEEYIAPQQYKVTGSTAKTTHAEPLQTALVAKTYIGHRPTPKTLSDCSFKQQGINNGT